MNETNKIKGVEMTQEKNLKKVKVIIKATASGENQRHYEDCAWLIFDLKGQWLGQKCDCLDRMNAYKGWNISDLSICGNEANNEIFDKRLMARTNLKHQGIVLHCSEGCADSWKRQHA